MLPPLFPLIVSKSGIQFPRICKNKKMAALTYGQVLLAIGTLISGSINTLSKKAQNDYL